MNPHGRVTVGRVLAGLAALIVVGGLVLALLSVAQPGLSGSLGSVSHGPGATYSGAPASFSQASNGANVIYGTTGSPYVNAGSTEVVGQGGTQMVSTTVSTTTALVPSRSLSNTTQGAPAGAGGLIEFSSDVSIRASSPQQTASGIVALAYSVGGYGAYQSTYGSSA